LTEGDCQLTGARTVEATGSLRSDRYLTSVRFIVSALTSLANPTIIVHLQTASCIVTMMTIYCDKWPVQSGSDANLLLRPSPAAAQIKQLELTGVLKSFALRLAFSTVLYTGILVCLT
jgi:hypothetical protein